MKFIFICMTSLFSVGAMALDDYNFSCDLGSYVIASKPGVKKAPESPVVGLNIKVLKQQVPLFLIKATANGAEKDLFVTDWHPKSILSQSGEELLDLLSLFYGIDIGNLDKLRAGVPTNLLDSFAYLELKDNSGAITKLGFEGSNPSSCQ